MSWLINKQIFFQAVCSVFILIRVFQKEETERQTETDRQRGTERQRERERSFKELAHIIVETVKFNYP